MPRLHQGTFPQSCRAGTVLLLAALGLGLACGGAAPPGPPGLPGTQPAPGPPSARPGEPPVQESPFPSPERLRDLGEEKAPGGFAEGDFVDVDAWTLRGPFPARLGEEPIAGPSPWEELLLEAAQRRAGLVVASEAMRCAARELGLFFVEHGAIPPPALQRYVMGRCGATGRSLGFGFYRNSVPPDAPEERIVEVWSSAVRELLAAQMGAGPRAVGIWFGRRGEEGVVLLVSAERRAHLEPASPQADSQGRVVLRGEVLAPAEEIDAQINQGRLGFASCDLDPDVRLPRFALSCPAEAHDAQAWITLSARAPGRLLADAALVLMARPSGDAEARWQRVSYAAPSVVADAAGFTERLLAELNRLRGEEGLAPLELEPQESRTAAELAPFYLGSSLGLLPPGYGDLVALGLMAGWQVRGTVRDAGVGAALVVATTDIDRWLAEALERPGMRSVLLDPQRTRLAVGPLVAEKGEYLGAVLASYELYGEADPGALRQDLYTRLDREYDQRGLRFPLRDRGVEDAATRQMLRIRNGAATPGEALEVLIQESSTMMRAPVRGWILEGRSVEDLPLPEALFEAKAVRIAAAVGHYQPAGWPWGRTVVLLVTAPESPVRTALGDVPARLSEGTLLARGADGPGDPISRGPQTYRAWTGEDAIRAPGRSGRSRPCCSTGSRPWTSRWAPSRRAPAWPRPSAPSSPARACGVLRASTRAAP